jgi:nicotinamidase-related amidase
MSEFMLDPRTTALVVIDLQRGITSIPTVPHASADVIARSSQLAKHFRSRGARVVLVRVDPGPGGILFPRPITDVVRPPMNPGPDWSEILSEMGPESGDVVVTKHHPGAFNGTDLDIQLRRRGVQTIVLCGISTNVGVEATARVGFEQGYNLVFAEDAMAARDVELHATSVSKFFPTIGRVRRTQEIIAALRSEND